MTQTIYHISLPRLGGGTLNLEDYSGRPLLIANTASKCGFTGQYAGLQRLWDTYRDRGLVVIGVPSNDFGKQEPGEETEIGAFCQQNFGVTFPMTGKLKVSGADAHPLFNYLGRQTGAFGRPRWNFYKFVINPSGRLAGWFSSLTSPDSTRVKRVIETCLRP